MEDDKNIRESKEEENEYFSRNDEYKLSIYDKDEEKWSTLYTTPDLLGSFKNTWTLREIKNIYKNDKVYAQRMTGSVSFRAVWESSSIKISSIYVEHNDKNYRLDKIPPP